MVAAAGGGCASPGGVLDQAEIDRTILTGSITPPGIAIEDASRASDAETIRNAVSAAGLPLATPLSWSNVDTGSEGVVTAIAEAGQGPATCRRFSATREAYDGISVVSGEACLSPGGAWTLTAFE